MEDLETQDPLFPSDFVTIHHLREQWLQRRQPQPQQKLKQLETRRRSPPGKPPQRRTPPPPPPPPPLFPPPMQEDQRKQPEKELRRREADVEHERVKGSPRKESDSGPSPANCWAVRRNASLKEGIDGRRAIGPKGPEKLSCGECAGFGADEKAESALVKVPRRPEQELARGEPNTESERVKASPTNASDSQRAGAVPRHTSVKEGSDGAIDSNGPKPSGKSSPGEGFGADEKAESALVKDQRKQPEKELPERERVKASPRNESDSRPSPANRRAGRRNTSVKEGSGGRQAIDSNGPKSSEKSSRREYAGFATDEKAESALVAAVSVVAEQVKKPEEWEKKKNKKNNNKNNDKLKGKGRLSKHIVSAKEKGVKPEDGEANERAEDVKKEKFRRAISEGQNVMLESKEVRVEAKPEEGVAHTAAKEAKKLFQRAGSESEAAMPESEEVQVEVENVAANASHVRAKAEGLNKQMWVINSKVKIEGELRSLSLPYDRKKGGFRSQRPNRGDQKGYGVIEGQKQQRIVRQQSSNVVWVRKDHISDGHAGESSS